MERSTVDFGIDLGTTNSEIAVLEGTTTHVIRTNENNEYTPSVVSIDRKGKLQRGEWAKSQQISDHKTERADVSIEFKLQMGHPEPVKAFKATGQQMTPEELSAEVLKKLREDVQRKYREELTAAAIGVPSAFELPQCSATDRAAKLAGLSFSPLVQEPVAAALAYGFQTTSDRVFWMVYDFGGGTFDAAIMRVRDEQIQVVNHGGDNHLGGKLIDWEIVNQLLVPVVAREFNLSPDDQRWEAIRAILKYYAELAKIRLSAEDETDMQIRHLFRAEDGVSIPFECELKRSDIERLAEPFIERSINKCKAVLEEARLSSADIEKLILVGAPTLTPLFREMLTQKLGIPLELRVDPLTVVARGAAIFAGTQIVPETSGQHVPFSAGQFKLDLDCKPVGDEVEPAIGGRVIAPEGQSLQGFTIEFVESKTSWRSGKINISDGTFVTTVYAERERRNEFLIELRDASGNLHEAVPDRFPYTIGITISAQSLVSNIGIALADNEMLTFLEKNTPLPAKHRNIKLQTTVLIRSGDSGTFLRIPVVEGTNKRADRNPRIGVLVVNGEKVRRDVPIGSDIEVTIAVDESRLTQVNAYIPFLDQEFEEVFDPKYSEIGEQELQELVDLSEKAKTRLEEVREKTRQTGSARADDFLQQIEDERLVHQIDTSLISVQQHDRNAPDECQRCRIDLDAKLDDIEDLIRWPMLVSEAEAEISGGRELVQKFGDSQDADDFSRLEDETRSAIASQNPDSLQQKIRSLSQLVMQVMMKHPGFWVLQLERLEEEYIGNMRDRAEAELLLAQGHRAIENEDIEGLKMAVRQLYGLLPDALAEDLRGYKSTVMKKGF